MSDDGTTTFVRMPDSFGFTQIPNPTIYDGRLSFEALGLLAVLLAKCEAAANRDSRWEIRNAHLYKMCKERSGWGRDKTNGLLAELTKLGYLESTCHREGGRFAWTRVLYSCPILNREYMATADGQTFRQEVAAHHGEQKVAFLEEVSTAYGLAAHGEPPTVYGSTVHGEAVYITKTLINTDDRKRAREAQPEAEPLVEPAPLFTTAHAHMVNALVDVTGIKARTARGGWSRAFEEKHVSLASELVAAGVTPEQVREWYGSEGGYWFAGDWRSHDTQGKPTLPQHRQIEEGYSKAARWTAADANPALAQRRPGADSEGASQWDVIYDALRRYGVRQYAQWRDGLDERAQRAVAAIGGSNLAVTPPKDVNPAGYNTARRQFLDAYNGVALAAGD